MNKLVGIPALLLTAALAFDAQAAQSARPMYLSLHHAARHRNAVPGTPQLPQWNGSFTDRFGQLITFTMVGGDPAKTGTTHVGLVLVPVIAIYGADNGNKTFDPRKHKEKENGQTVIQNVASSPLFTSNIDYIQGGTDLGTTQFIDAFQRGNFWSSVKKNRGYHLLYDVSVGDPMKIRVSQDQGSVIQNPEGRGKIGTYGFAAFDELAQSYMAAHADTINPSVVPLFLTYSVLLTSGGCCVEGYHAAQGGPPGGQTYAFAGYIDARDRYVEDISVLAIELGQLTDDPFSMNGANCPGGFDIAETVKRKNLYPYLENNFTYHLPSLDFVTYFGAPRSTSVNRWYSFQGDVHHVCAGQ